MKLKILTKVISYFIRINYILLPHA